MSALGSKADMSSAQRHVRFAPKADISRRRPRPALTAVRCTSSNCTRVSKIRPCEWSETIGTYFLKHCPPPVLLLRDPSGPRKGTESVCFQLGHVAQLLSDAAGTMPLGWKAGACRETEAMHGWRTHSLGGKCCGHRRLFPLRRCPLSRLASMLFANLDRCVGNRP